MECCRTQLQERDEPHDANIRFQVQQASKNTWTLLPLDCLGIKLQHARQKQNRILCYSSLWCAALLKIYNVYAVCSESNTVCGNFEGIEVKSDKASGATVKSNSKGSFDNVVNDEPAKLDFGEKCVNCLPSLSSQMHDSAIGISAGEYGNHNTEPDGEVVKEGDQMLMEPKFWEAESTSASVQITDVQGCIRQNIVFWRDVLHAPLLS